MNLTMLTRTNDEKNKIHFLLCFLAAQFLVYNYWALSGNIEFMSTRVAIIHVAQNISLLFVGNLIYRFGKKSKEISDFSISLHFLISIFCFLCRGIYTLTYYREIKLYVFVLFLCFMLSVLAIDLLKKTKSLYVSLKNNN